MSKVKAVLMEFDAGDSDSEGQQGGIKITSQNIKYGHFKADTCQIEKNLLYSNVQSFNDYILPEKPTKKIRLVSQHQHVL